MRSLSSTELTDTNQALLGSLGQQINQAVFAMALGQHPILDPAVEEKLHSLGWLEDSVLTPLGLLVSDPLREFGFWLDRNGKLPSEGDVPAIDRTRFANKEILEIGSGGGCNLFSLFGYCKSVVGIEPMPVYNQISPILAESKGMPAPHLVQASAENIPFQANSFDIVMCISSHQYMQIIPAVKEMARVLKSGGELVIIGNTLYPYAVESFTRAARYPSLRSIRYDGTSLMNTIFYQLFGRRLVRSNISTTAAPIYPSFGFMGRQFESNQLRIDPVLTCQIASGETVFVAHKL